VRELGIGQTKDSRCDKVPDKPGAEMKHDTIPCTVKRGGFRAEVFASLMYLTSSKRRYLRFYRALNCFRIECFFHEVITVSGYVPEICVIDKHVGVLETLAIDDPRSRLQSQ
jgi:hypothetical protein